MKRLPIILEAPQAKPEEKFVLALAKKFSLVAENQIITPIDRKKLWQKIFTAHNQSSRAYHNLSHLYSIIEIFDEFNLPDLNQSVFYWTTFFHDYIYKAHKKDNEVKSAGLAKKVLSSYLPSENIKRVVAIIESTARHQPIIDVPEQYAFLDADLAILASDKMVYDKYTEAIRQEYRIYPDLLYRSGRRKVLEYFLEREEIYYTSYFKKYETKARGNLIREIEALN